MLERGELGLTHRAGTERQQTRDGDHGLAQPGALEFAREPGRHFLRGHHGVQASRPHLVGPRHDTDHTERSRFVADVVADLTQELDVGRVQRSQQVDHGVGAGRLVVGGEHLEGAGRHVPRQRGRARGVDDRRVSQGGRRPLHVETVHLVGGEVAEVEREMSVPAQHRDVGGTLSATTVVRLVPGRHGGRRPAAVPGDDAGALGRVGGRDVLSHQGIEQSGLACLQRTGQSHPQRLFQSPGAFGQLIPDLGSARVQLPGGRDECPGLVKWSGRHAVTAPASPATSCAACCFNSDATCRSFSSCAIRRVRSVDSRFAASCAPRSESLIDRNACSAIALK